LKTARPDGPLEIQPNFLAEQADVDALVAGVELGLDLAAQPAYRDLIRRWVAPPARLSRDGTVAFLRRSCLSHLHPVGTCAMGTGREAVVDAELRVRGVEGRRVADASVMPTIPSAPTNAPAVMIGEFASRLLVAGSRRVRSYRVGRLRLWQPLKPARNAKRSAIPAKKPRSDPLTILHEKRTATRAPR
jgi:choline dehydrogenase